MKLNIYILEHNSPIEYTPYKVILSAKLSDFAVFYTYLYFTLLYFTLFVKRELEKNLSTIAVALHHSLFIINVLSSSSSQSQSLFNMCIYICLVLSHSVSYTIL